MELVSETLSMPWDITVGFGIASDGLLRECGVVGTLNGPGDGEIKIECDLRYQDSKFSFLFLEILESETTDRLVDILKTKKDHYLFGSKKKRSGIAENLRAHPQRLKNCQDVDSGMTWTKFQAIWT